MTAFHTVRDTCPNCHVQPQALHALTHTKTTSPYTRCHNRSPRTRLIDSLSIEKITMHSQSCWCQTTLQPKKPKLLGITQDWNNAKRFKDKAAITNPINLFVHHHSACSVAAHALQRIACVPSSHAWYVQMGLRGRAARGPVGAPYSQAGAAQCRTPVAALLRTRHLHTALYTHKRTRHFKLVNAHRNVHMQTIGTTVLTYRTLKTSASLSKRHTHLAAYALALTSVFVPGSETNYRCRLPLTPGC